MVSFWPSFFLGWGTLEFGGLPSSKLQKVSLDVITTAQCKQTYGDIVTDKQICTYKDQRDACQVCVPKGL